MVNVLIINNAGAGFRQPPQRDPIFRDAKFFCFGAINNRRNIGWIFLFAVTSDGCLPGSIDGLRAYRPLTSNTAWCSVFVISSVENQAAVGTRVTVTAMKLAEPLYQSIKSRALLATLTETV